jgi:hypothetical protein
MKHLLLFPLVLLAACPTDDPPAELRWYSTCGSPACGGYQGPFDGVPECTDEVEGEACASADARCDLVNDCDVLLACVTEDPTQQPGGCPISRRKFKRDIHYLDPAEREAAATQALSMGLSTWSYTWDPPGARARLGFIIDDHEGSQAVTADGDHVDLYGYTSLTLAAVQAEHARLDAQQAEIDALRAELAALKASLRAR